MIIAEYIRGTRFRTSAKCPLTGSAVVDESDEAEAGDLGRVEHGFPLRFSPPPGHRDNDVPDALLGLLLGELLGENELVRERLLDRDGLFAGTDRGR